MPKTAVVNKRRRRRRNTRRAPARKANPRRRRRARQRNYGSASTVNRRRRRSSRRRNPASPYASRGYMRRPNPGMFDFQELMDVVPPATAGIFATRWAIRQAGPFEPAADGVLEPGLKHAIAVFLAASLGGQLVSSLFGSAAAGDYARIAALGWGGDLFLTRRFARDSQFVQENLSLQGGSGMGSFYEQNQLAGGGMGDASYTDGAGNTYVVGPDGSWQLAGLGGFEEYNQLASGLGAPRGGMRRAYANSDSSFGYSE